MRRETGNIEEAETITAAEMLRSLDLYRQLTGKPLVGPAAVIEVAEEEPPAPAAEPEKPAAPVPSAPPAPPAADATVTALDTARKPSRP